MLPFSSFFVLNSVLPAIRSISFFSEVISEAMAPRSVSVRVSFDALDRQLTHALEDRVGLVQAAFSGLDHRDAVLGVANRLVEALDLATQLLADRQASRVIADAG